MYVSICSPVLRSTAPGNWMYHEKHYLNVKCGFFYKWMQKKRDQMLHAEIHAWVGWLDHREVFNLHDDLLIPRRIWMDPLCQCGFFTVCLYSGPTARNTETVPHSGRRVYFPANGDRHCRSAELGQCLCDRSAHGSFCSRWENDGSCCLCDSQGMVFRAEQGSW